MKFRVRVPAFEVEVETVDQPAPPVDPPPAVVPPAGPQGWTGELVLDERFEQLDPQLWKVEHSSYGGIGASGNRLQYFRPENVTVVGPAAPGGNGNSLRLTARREEYKGAGFTGGMISTRDVKKYYPRYGRYEFRARLPHGQGVWPAFWLRHRDGSSICEPDVMEYFHAQHGPAVSCALHRTDEAGKYATNVLGGKAYLEPPTSDMDECGWHTFSMEILPWTAGTVPGGKLGDPTKPSSNVRFLVKVDERIMMDRIDTSAGNWTRRYDADALDITLQGSQIGGDWAGHPDDPLGWSRWRNACLSRAGTGPDACRTDMPDGPIIRAAFPNYVEVDHVRVWRLT